MPSKGVQDRVFLAAPTIWAAFAYSEFVSEAARRLYPEHEAKRHEMSPEERAQMIDKRLDAVWEGSSLREAAREFSAAH